MLMVFDFPEGMDGACSRCDSKENLRYVAVVKFTSSSDGAILCTKCIKELSED